MRWPARPPYSRRMTNGNGSARVDWETRVAALWTDLDRTPPEVFVARMDDLAASAPDGAMALFERAGARDSVGLEAEAVTLYRQALAAGLDGAQRRQAVIQLASSLRNVGQVREGLALLEQERQRGSDELDGALAAFLALMLVDRGREREAVSVLLNTLAGHLPRYQRSVRNYARLLVDSAQAAP